MTGSCEVAIKSLCKEQHLKQPLKGRQGGGQMQLDWELIPKGWCHNWEGPGFSRCFSGHPQCGNLEKHGLRGSDSMGWCSWGEAFLKCNSWFLCSVLQKVGLLNFQNSSFIWQLFTYLNMTNLAPFSLFLCRLNAPNSPTILHRAWLLSIHRHGHDLVN